MGSLIYFGIRRNRASRRRNYHNRLNNPYNRHHLHPGGVQQYYVPPPQPMQPVPFNQGPGYPNSTAPGYPVPTQNPNAPGYDPYLSPNWPTDPGPTAWPEPVPPPPGKVIQAAPGSIKLNDPNLPTKDIYVWGRSAMGWVYAGKLTVVKSMQEREIKQYADGKFGIELYDKLCIEADNFEQARYIFEQSRYI